MQACVYHDFVCICNVCLLYMCIRVNKNGKIFLYACSDKCALYKWVKGAPAGASRFGDFNLGLTGCEAEEFSQVRSP